MHCISQRPGRPLAGQPSAAMASPIIRLRHRTAKNCISHPNRLFMNPSSPPAIESHSKDPGHQSTAGNRFVSSP